MDGELSEPGFRVIIPLKSPQKRRGRWTTTRVSYPTSGERLYTREEAIEVLKKLFERSPWKDGDELEPWAENEKERFTLFFPENLF